MYENQKILFIWSSYKKNKEKANHVHYYDIHFQLCSIGIQEDSMFRVMREIEHYSIKRERERASEYKVSITLKIKIKKVLTNFEFFFTHKCPIHH